MRSLIIACLLLTLLLPTTLDAQSDIPVVYGVFFFSPTCPHCHKVMENDFPRMQAEFGDQFQILYVNVQTQGGSLLFQSAYNSPAVPVRSGGVPQLVIGREVMVGSIEIPERAFDIIRQGLRSGGIGLPDIPGLREAYAAALAGARGAGVEQGESATPSGRGPFDTADMIATTVLVILVVSLIAVIGAGVRTLRSRHWRIANSQAPRVAAIVIAIGGVAVGLTLAAEALQSPVVLVVALVEIAALAVIAVTLWRRSADKAIARLSGGLLPVAALGGLAVAAYLSYVEVTQSDAICGLVGECNLVQQSDYARLFGVLPIGVLGVFGYGVILALWFAATRLNPRDARYASVALFGAALFGVGFSVYLTLIELVVINAVCMWCISSALVSALILWLVATDGWESVRALRQQRA